MKEDCAHNKTVGKNATQNCAFGELPTNINTNVRTAAPSNEMQATTPIQALCESSVHMVITGRSVILSGSPSFVLYSAYLESILMDTYRCSCSYYGFHALNNQTLQSSFNLH